MTVNTIHSYYNMILDRAAKAILNKCTSELVTQAPEQCNMNVAYTYAKRTHEVYMSIRRDLMRVQTEIN